MSVFDNIVVNVFGGREGKIFFKNFYLIYRFSQDVTNTILASLLLHEISYILNVECNSENNRPRYNF